MSVCDRGIYTPYPPFCLVPQLRAVFETSRFCRGVGSVGPKSDSIRSKRAPIMLTAALVSFACMLLQLIPVISISDNAGTIEATHWTSGRGDFTNTTAGITNLEVDVYISVSAYAFNANGNTSAVRWNNADCQVSQCDNCKNVASSTISVAIIAFITSVAQVATDLQRSSLEGDLNCQRFQGIATALLGFFTTISALSSFMSACGNEFDTDIDFEDGSTMRNTSYTWGPSAACLAIATFLKFFDLICHALIVTPALKRSKDDADSLFKLDAPARRELLLNHENGGQVLVGESPEPSSPSKQQSFDAITPI
eukprot:m.216277 g.216277  ORF g.216277 m.216277 type:complete len:310 (-) comp28257_c0_seq1:179-1108(-)